MFLKSQVIQNAITAPANGDAILLNAYNLQSATLLISLSGTATSFTAQFMASLDGINYVPVCGTKSTDGITSANSTSVMNEAWEFDVSAYTHFKCYITAVSGGNVTVTANLAQ